MFCLDLDELDSLHASVRLFSRNSFNIFSFRDKDHLDFGKSTVKENILEFLSQNGISLNNGKIFLVTNVRMFGYVFNPVSFYFCYDEQGNPVCAVPEVGNTFGELKPYLLRGEDRTKDGFRKTMTKFFYVSPFIDLDAVFDFNLHLPGEKLHVTIDDSKEGKKFFVSSVHGVKKALNDARLLWYVVRFPFITLQVIGLIHWQAMKLYLKKLPFLKKSDNPELQKEIVIWNK
jgi:DUF1365 family protein